jgi:hypothetical protein
MNMLRRSGWVRFYSHAVIVLEDKHSHRALYSPRSASQTSYDSSADPTDQQPIALPPFRYLTNAHPTSHSLSTTRFTVQIQSFHIFDAFPFIVCHSFLPCLLLLCGSYLPTCLILGLIMIFYLLVRVRFRSCDIPFHHLLPNTVVRVTTFWR